MTRFSRGAGFTLIEMAAVMVISGLIIACLSQAYRLYLNNRALNDTYDRLTTIDAAIGNYLGANGRYPCPADPTLSESDPNYGVEVPCQGVLPPTHLTADPLYLAATGACISNVCKIPGARDTLVDVDAALDPVYVGAIPWKTLKLGQAVFTSGPGSKDCIDAGFPEKATDDGHWKNCDILENSGAGDGNIDPNLYLKPSLMTSASYNDPNMDVARDPYGYQMTYAVTAALTSRATYDVAFGAIRVQTEQTPTHSLTNPDGAAQYVLQAAGQNHLGAYHTNPFTPAKITAPCAGTGLDVENCNGDATFVEGVMATGNDPAKYYDDIVRHTNITIDALWKPNGNTLYNNNIGNVGVGTNTPGAKFDVVDNQGDPDKGSLRVTNMRQGQICDTNGVNCWDPSKFGGTTAAATGGAVCSQTAPFAVGANQKRVMSGIRNGDVYCPTVINLPPATPAQTCPSGQFIKGFNADGSLACGVP